MIDTHLAQAEWRVAEGERWVEDQRKLVGRLQRDGHDAMEALLLLGEFEEMLARYRADRDRLLDERHRSAS